MNLMTDNMNTTDFTPEKSLQLISEMIEKSRKDFEKDSGTPMIVWGLTVTAVSAAVAYLLMTTGNPYWNFLWFAIPAIGYPLAYFTYGKKDEKRAKNFLGTAISGVWGTFGVLSILIAVIACFFFNEAIGYITPMIILLLGFSTTLTGLFVRNYVISSGGFITAVAGSVLSIAVSPEMMPLLLAGSAVIALLIPGIILNLRKK